MGIGLLIDFLLEATFGVAFDTVTQGFMSYQDLSAVRAMSAKQKAAFLQSIMLVMMADGGLSGEEQQALDQKLSRLRLSSAELDTIERIKRETSEALHEGRARELVEALLVALPEKSHRQAMVNVAWEVHRIDDHHVADKMDILHQLCRETGFFPAGVDG